MTPTPDADSRDDWIAGPIAPHQYAHLFDTLISLKDRLQRSVCLLVLDDDDRLAQPIVINGVPDPAPDPTAMLAHLAGLIATEGHTVVAGYARPGGAALTAEDQRWQGFVAEAFGPRLLGCYLITSWRVLPYADCPPAA